MASRATQSLTTGMKILGGANLPTYTLEFLTPTGKHAKGSYVTIAVPYAEIGRDTNCTVRLGDNSATVSRKHAAIERKDKDVFIVNLSQTNPTLVNGRPVNKKYFLTNGDEIQLSMEGPRLRYNETQTGTAKMGFTNRMNLVMQQSIKPYKTVAIFLFLLIIGITSASGYFIFDLNQQSRILNDQTKLLEKQAAEDRERYKEELKNATDSYLTKLGDLNKRNSQLASSVSNLKGELEEVKINAANAKSDESSAEAYQTHKGEVYFMYVSDITITYQDGSKQKAETGWTCTGFLLSNGRFVTARHCVQGWRYLNNTAGGVNLGQLLLNTIETSGASVNVTIEAVSPTRTLTLNSKNVVLDDRNDKVVQQKVDIEGEEKSFDITVASLDQSDWSYFNTPFKSNLNGDNRLSSNLTAGKRVIIMGYSYGIGGSNLSQSVSPLLSESLVAQDGLSSDGTINLTDRNFGQGNSGGPVLVKDGDVFKAIGIVSAGVGDEIGFIVPLSAIK